MGTSEARVLDPVEQCADDIVSAYLSRHGDFPTRVNVALTLVLRGYEPPHAYLDRLAASGWLRPSTAREQARERVYAEMLSARDWEDES